MLPARVGSHLVGKWSTAVNCSEDFRDDCWNALLAGTADIGHECADVPEGHNPEDDVDLTFNDPPITGRAHSAELSRTRWKPHSGIMQATSWRAWCRAS